MAVPLLLFATAALVGWLAGYPLSQAGWTRQAPRLGVALWHALCLGVVSSVALGGAALAVPMLPPVLTGGFSDLLARCAAALQDELATPGSPVIGILGLAAALAMLGRVGWAATTLTLGARRLRRGQLEGLALAGRRLGGDHGEDVVLLDDDRPAAYCLPGRSGGTIAISTGSIDLLTDDQLRLVLAHERAHLRQRHHLATRLSSALSIAFGRVPLFQLAAREVPLLLEMAADDQALRTVGVGIDQRTGVRDSARQRLGHALVTLATAQPTSPTGALAATGGSAVARVRRLSEPPLRTSPARITLLGLAVLVASAGPALVASAPALCAAAMDICPALFT